MTVTHKAYAVKKPALIRRQLSLVRRSLIQDLGGLNNLSAQRIIILDGVISKLGVVRSMEEYIRSTAIMEGKELSPCLRKNYLAYRNSIDRSLVILGLDKQERESVLSIPELIDVVDREADEKEAKKKARKS